MADANALTYRQLQDAVLGKRFPQSKRADAKRWLATAYADVWAAADWTFKRVSRAALTIQSGDNTPTMPADFGEALQMFDQFGSEIGYVSQELFERMYADQFVQNIVGVPEAFTAVGRQVYLAPIPSGGTGFTLSYMRRLASRDSGLNVQAGFMVNDGDYPLWDDHHSLLIPRAMVLGLQELNDPSFPPLQDEYERQLDRMRSDYEQRRPTRQWAAVSWDA